MVKTSYKVTYTLSSRCLLGVCVVFLLYFPLFFIFFYADFIFLFPPNILLWKFSNVKKSWKGEIEHLYVYPVGSVISINTHFIICVSVCSIFYSLIFRGILIQILLNLYIALDSTDIFTILFLWTHKYEISVHLFVSSSFFPLMS